MSARVPVTARTPEGDRSLAWWASIVTVLASSAVVLVACTSTPAPSSVPPVSGSATPSVVTATPSATPSPTPTAPPGPTLTKAQFAKLIASGKIGDRDASLSPASIDGAEDPDGEGAEGQQQSEAKSCVKMYALAARELKAQASDDDQGAAMQLFSKPASATELFDLNIACAGEQARYSPDTATSTVATGAEGSALWWLSKDPDLNYQVTVVYGNVMAFDIVEADTDCGALTRAFIAQVDEVGKA